MPDGERQADRQGMITKQCASSCHGTTTKLEDRDGVDTPIGGKLCLGRGCERRRNRTTADNRPLSGRVTAGASGERRAGSEVSRSAA